MSADPEQAEPRGNWLRRGFDRLGTRLALMLAIALFPIFVVIVVQSQSMLKTVQARSEAALLGETLRTVAGKTRLIQEARAQMRLLARVLPDKISDSAACDDLMTRAKHDEQNAAFVGFVSLNGQMTCGSNGQHFDFSNHPRMMALLESESAIFSISAYGAITGMPVMLVGQVVRDSDGRKLGLVFMSLPYAVLASIDQQAEEKSTTARHPLEIVTFARGGKIIATTGNMASADRNLPADLDLEDVSGEVATTFSAKSQSGEKRDYSIVDLIPDQLYAIGTWPDNALETPGLLSWMSPAVMPFLMWAISIVFVYVAVQHMVIRHLRKLSRALSNFASGGRIVGQLGLRRAPAELRELAESYASMTETILHDEAELEDMIHQKEVLLREVHHRVKNNLQLITSIINMQVRRARSAESKGMLRSLQDRVMSLATVHRGLYMASGMTEVGASALVRDIVNELLRATTAPEHKIGVDIAVDAFELTPDQAVPLSLLITEAVTNAIKYARAPDGRPKIALALRYDPDHRARLVIRNSRTEAAAPEPAASETVQTDGLGLQLVQAFAHQLGGRLEVATTENEHILSLDFEVIAFEPDDLAGEGPLGKPFDPGGRSTPSSSRAA